MFFPARCVLVVDPVHPVENSDLDVIEVDRELVVHPRALSVLPQRVLEVLEADRAEERKNQHDQIDKDIQG